MNIGDFLLGAAMFGAGVLILANKEWLIQNAIDSGDRFFERFCIAQASEPSRRVGGKVIVTLLGWFFILSGLLQLVLVLTGQAGFQ